MTFVLGGVGSMLPWEIFEKRCNVVHSERSEIINLKINNFRDNKSTTKKLFGIFLPSINPAVHVNKQKKHFIKGVLGHEHPPPRSKDFLKKN